MEHLMDQTAITYPYTTADRNDRRDDQDDPRRCCDNLFNPDPYYQQGGDMVRVGGISTPAIRPARWAAASANMRLNGKPIEPGKKYKVAGWAPVAEGATGEPIWEVVGDLPARQESRHAGQAQHADDQGCGGQSRHRLKPWARAVAPR